MMERNARGRGHEGRDLRLHHRPLRSDRYRCDAARCRCTSWVRMPGKARKAFKAVGSQTCIIKSPFLVYNTSYGKRG